MSELKAFYMPRYAGQFTMHEVYLKSEADKVIAELKKKIEEQKRLRDMALASVPNALKVAKIIQHNKYKRCLAMAYVEWLRQMILCNYTQSFIYRRAASREHKWKEMAQKFKEAK